MDATPDFELLMPALRRLNKTSLSLLGAPTFPEGVGSALEVKRLVRAQGHLGHLSAHVSLVMLQNCFVCMYILRTSPS